MKLLKIILLLMCSVAVDLASNSTRSKRTYSGTIEEYHYPNFFWPLDYPTWIREVIESKNTIITGQQIGIIGASPGFMKFGVKESSVKLGQFGDTCLTQLTQCTDGITISLWTYVTNVDTGLVGYIGQNEFSVLRTTPSSAGISSLRIWYSQQNGKIYLHSTIHHQKKVETKYEVITNQWYHVILQYSKRTGMNFFVNLQLANNTVLESRYHVDRFLVELFLGQYPLKFGIESVFRKAELQLDNLAIWKKVLTIEELHKIYTVGLGEIKLLPRYVNTNGQFTALWTKPMDYYSQILNYKITWHPKTEEEEKNIMKEYNSIIIPSIHSDFTDDQPKQSFEFELEFYGKSTDYIVRVVAMTIGGITIGSELQCFTNVTKENHLLIESTTPFSLTITWTNPPRIKNTTTYTITYVPVKDVNTPRENVQTKNLPTQLTGLQPFTEYNVTVTRLEVESKIQSQHNGVYKTLPLAPTYKMSLESLHVTNITWNSAILNLVLHPGLKNYPMTYVIYQNSGEENLKTRLNVQGYSKFQFEMKDLMEDTSYTFDVELFDRGSKLPGPRMTKPIVVTTKVRFTPPKDIIVENITTSSITVQVVLSSEAFDPSYNITHLDVNVIQTDSNGLLETKLLPRSEPQLFTVHDLKPFTNYTISISAGNGHMFGQERTKVVKTLDLNECAETESPCSRNSICINLPGSYQCHCVNGYTKVADECQDINECSNPTVCSQNSICLNNVGSHECKCKNGYTMVGKICKDINECIEKEGKICEEDEVCVNAIGSYSCHCKVGYKRNGNNVCRDINECPNEKCGNNSLCINILGSYQCQCAKGYKMVNNTCTDINECLGFASVCKENEKCVNILGSYKCTIKSGFHMQKNISQTINDSNVCPQERSRGINWGVTAKNTTAVAPCPEGSIGNATRKCSSVGTQEKPFWRKSNMSKCISIELSNIIESMSTNRESIVAARRMHKFVKKTIEMHSGDLKHVVSIMKNIISVNVITNSVEAESYSETMVNITSSLLGESTAEAWNDLTPEVKAEQAEKLLTTSEAIIEVSAKNLAENVTSKTIVTKNIVMTLKRLPTDGVKDDDAVKVTTDQSIILPGDAIKNVDDNMTSVAIVTYKGLGELIGVPKNSTIGKSSKNLTINSNIISISVFPQQKQRFDKPVVVVQELIEYVKNGTEPNCVYWQESKQGGYWSTEGCSVYHFNNSHVTCHCFHLTNFAVLMSVKDAGDSLTPEHTLALNMITLIGVSISLVAMIAAFLTFILVRAIRSLRNTIHQHLIVALFIAEGLFIFGIDRIENHIVCQVIAATLHYFFLVAFSIMALEGIVLYFMLIRVYKSMGTTGYGSNKYIILCWVLPVVAIAINVSIDRRAYGYNQEYCWLSIRHGFIWSFVGPVLFIILFNLVILFKTLRIMSIKAKKRTAASEEIWFWTKGSSLLLSILGITWIFGVFYMDTNTLFAAYLFNIINSLQGLSIFIFHCLCDPRVRKAYYNFICCVQHPSHMLQSRTRTTSTGSKNASKKRSKSKKKYIVSMKGEDLPLYDTSSSAPENSFGVLVGTNKF